MSEIDPGDAPGVGTQELKRDFTLRMATSLAFVFISPIVALWAIFTVAMQGIGPGFWWAFPLVFAGQMLVALSLGMLASRWPFEGSVYQWARRAVSGRFGWLTGWIYIWTLVIAMASVSFVLAIFLAEAVGVSGATQGALVLIALGAIVAVTAVNMTGAQGMKIAIRLSVAAEVFGSLGVGIYLLIRHRQQTTSVLVSDALVAIPDGAFMSMPLLIAVAIVGWSFLGFESAGAIAEEVKDPERAVPKAMWVSLCLVASVVAFTALAVILAIPDVGAVADGSVEDVFVETLALYFSPGVLRFIFVLFVIGFGSTLLAVQATASRVIFAFARDEVLPASGYLSQLSERRSMPRRALILTALMAAVMFVPFQSDNLFDMLLAFTTAGFYASFGLPVLGLAIARRRGTWVDGAFSLGRSGPLISTAALIWVAAQFVNITWPRFPELGWVVNWAPHILGTLILLVGLAVRASIGADRIESATLTGGNPGSTSEGT